MKTILFDLDGTLTDPFEGISRCIIHALEMQGLPTLPAEHLRCWIGPPLLNSFADYFELLGRGDARQALVHYRERFSVKGLFENTVYSGVPQLMKRLADSGYPIYLATAKPQVYARRIVEHFGLDQYLRRSYGSELDGQRTDKIELLAHLVRTEGLNCADCIMVGDREYDMLAGRYHDMATIGVLWGYGSESELLASGADSLASDPAQLGELIG